MPGIGDRIEGWVDKVSAKWKDRLAGWLAGWLAGGLNKAVEDKEPEIISLTQETLAKLKASPNLPLELRSLLDKATATGDLYSVFLGYVLTVIGAIPALFGSGKPLGNLMSYYQDYALRSFRLDPAQVMAAYWRDPTENEKYFNDLRDQGWTEDRILALRELGKVIPGVPDLIRMAVREAFSPEIAERFGQYEDKPAAVYPWAMKLGLMPEWVDRYWAAHWDLPSPMQGFEMLHRGIIGEDDLKLLLRALDVMPFWRDKLIEMSWNIPTRVDIRRFFDMGVIDEGRLRELYTAYGYHGTDLDNYVAWTIKQTKTVKTTAEKELTKAEIIKGVKKGVLSWDEGVELIMGLDYDAATADLILAINLAAAAGSPETVEEFRDLTQKYRKAAGMSAKPVTEELKKAAVEVVRLTREVKSLTEAVETEKKTLVSEEPLPEAATAKLRELQVSQHRAEAEHARAKGEYDKLLAQWRHKAT
jgi:hypothetical protein